MFEDLRDWLTGPESRPRQPLPLVAACPACGDELRITRLRCTACGTGVEGTFSLGRLQRLSRDQAQFLETFVRCRGKLKDVGEALGVSYPTVVSRLNDLVQRMGLEVSAQEAEAGEHRQRVLDDLEQGLLDVGEAATRLRDL